MPELKVVPSPSVPRRNGDIGGSGSNTGDGMPPGGNGLEARVAVLENNVDHIKADIAEIKGDVKELARAHDRDFRILFGALIAVAIGLAGMIAKGFHWL